MGLRVRFAAYDSARYEPYSTTLEQMGVKILDGSPRTMDTWLKRYGRQIRYAYINRPHVAQQFMAMVRRHSKARIIYNSVDFGFLRELRKAELEHDEAALVRAHELKKQEFGLFQQSDVVYTVSEYEKSLLQAELPRKRVVTIPTFFYEPPFPTGMPTPMQDRSDLTFVGGFNHSPNADGVLWFSREVFPLIQARLPEIRLNIIGPNPPAEVIALQSDSIRITGYMSDEELERYYANTRVVVAPLRYGAGVKGKVIEAVARGIPIVTTSIGIEGIQEPGETIAVGDSPEAFAAQVTDLYINEERWWRTRGTQIHYSNRFLTSTYAKHVLYEDIQA